MKLVEVNGWPIGKLTCCQVAKHEWLACGKLHVQNSIEFAHTKHDLLAKTKWLAHGKVHFPEQH